MPKKRTSREIVMPNAPEYAVWHVVISADQHNHVVAVCESADKARAWVARQRPRLGQLTVRAVRTEIEPADRYRVVYARIEGFSPAHPLDTPSLKTNSLDDGYYVGEFHTREEALAVAASHNDQQISKAWQGDLLWAMIVRVGQPRNLNGSVATCRLSEGEIMEETRVVYPIEVIRPEGDEVDQALAAVALY
jgi:hypothetical protein